MTIEIKTLLALFKVTCNTMIKPISKKILTAVKSSEYMLFPKPSNIFAEIIENGTASMETIPNNAIQYISVCIPVMENKLNI